MPWLIIAAGVVLLALLMRRGGAEPPKRKRARKPLPDAPPDIGPLIDNAKPGLQVSQLGKARGIESAPLLVLGDHPIYAVSIAAYSTLSTFWLPSIQAEGLDLDGLMFCGVLAMSPAKEPGTASALIAHLKRTDPEMPAIYAGWDYDFERCAPHGLECGADRVLPPAIETNEFLAFVLNTLSEHHQEPDAEPSLERYRHFLKLHCPTRTAPGYLAGLPPSKNW